MRRPASPPAPRLLLEGFLSIAALVAGWEWLAAADQARSAPPPRTTTATDLTRFAGQSVRDRVRTLARLAPGPAVRFADVDAKPVTVPADATLAVAGPDLPLSDESPFRRSPRSADAGIVLVSFSEPAKNAVPRPTLVGPEPPATVRPMAHPGLGLPPITLHASGFVPPPSADADAAFEFAAFSLAGAVLIGLGATVLAVFVPRPTAQPCPAWR